MTEFCDKSWSSGKIIALFCLFESALKLSISIAELTFGHLKGAVPSEIRGLDGLVADLDNHFNSRSFAVFIHSIIFVFIGVLGILCSTLLLVGLSRKTSGKIVWWICFQGIAIFHQIFFSLEIIAIVDHNARNKVLVLFAAVFLCFYVIVEGYFIKFIIILYQEIIVVEEANSRPRQSWRIPTVSELLGDECDISESTPPVYSLANSSNGRSTSEA